MSRAREAARQGSDLAICVVRENASLAIYDRCRIQEHSHHGEVVQCDCDVLGGRFGEIGGFSSAGQFD